MEMYFSIIIPVYNRPDEIKELMDSLLQSTYKKDYEVVIVEDGSQIDCKRVVEEYSNKLTISYYFKQNSGPGDSRNYGMASARIPPKSVSVCSISQTHFKLQIRLS